MQFAFEFTDAALRLGTAVVGGGLVGLERQLHGRWVGVRTHMMVALGSAVFVMAGLGVSEDWPTDTTRVVQGVAAGIGFLGAGTILKLTGMLEIKGLTTASSIWLSAALGTAAALAMYNVVLLAVVMALLVLAVLRPLEKRFDLGRPAEKEVD